MQFDLVDVPNGAIPRSVEVATVQKAGRPALSVTFDERTARGIPNVDYIDMPTFLELPIEFDDGELSVDILSELRPDAPDYARGFAGLAFRVCEASFEAVYLRPMNGLRLDPPPPRSSRAIQYFSYPNWKFEKLRETYPDGRYEAPADILPGRWTNLRVTVKSANLTARVDGKTVLTLADAKPVAPTGRVGLFVDIGTQAYFSKLKILR